MSVQFALWRAEIAAELDEAEAAVAAAKAAVAQAEAASVEPRLAHRAVIVALQRLDQRAPLAPAILDRVQDVKRHADAAVGRVQIAKGHLRNVELHAGNLRAALEQLEQLMRADEQEMENAA